MATQPTLAVRNAIAFVDLTGNFASHTQYDTRRQAQRWEDDNYLWVRHVALVDVRCVNRLRFYEVTEAGREVAARGTLAKCLAWRGAQRTVGSSIPIAVASLIISP